MKGWLTWLKKLLMQTSKKIEQLLKAVLQRYTVLFPDYEVSTVSLQKSSDRNEQLDCMIASLQKNENHILNSSKDRSFYLIIGTHKLRVV